VAQVGLGQVDAALRSFEQLQAQDPGGGAAQWSGTLHLQQGQARLAEAQLRGALERASGDSRGFALLWLYLATEAEGRGRATIAPHLDDVDPKTLVGALLHHFAGRLDREQLLALARQPADMERLNLAEAWFYLGQQHLVRGETEAAVQAMHRVLDTDAVPYREHTLARLALRRLQGE
jgi:lipoprotein NlpI